jgi:hypothetical protein
VSVNLKIEEVRCDYLTADFNLSFFLLSGKQLSIGLNGELKANILLLVSFIGDFFLLSSVLV